MADELDYLNNLIDQAADANGEVEVEMALLALCMRNNEVVIKTVENGFTQQSDIRRHHRHVP